VFQVIGKSRTFFEGPRNAFGFYRLRSSVAKPDEDEDKDDSDK
jgi:hypothetical protein